MATPVSGPISFADIQAAFGFGYGMNNYQNSRWYQPASLVYGNFSPDQISFSDFYNKQGADPAGNGSQTFPIAGTTSFTVPLYRNTFTIKMWGGGGGGGSYELGGAYGQTGGTSSTTFNSFVTAANGGTGGQNALTYNGGGLAFGANGTGGTASGNVTSTTGRNGYNYGVGAGAPNGGGDVAPAIQTSPSGNGSVPGGGGSGFYYSTGGKFPAVAGGGGSGGYALSTYLPSQVPAGVSGTVVVGAGGAPGATGRGAYGGTGGVGQIIISWS